MTTPHPATTERFQVAAQRFLDLQKEHRRMADALWVGLIASAFTDDELSLLSDYLSQNDVRLLQRVRQPIPSKASEVVIKLGEYFQQNGNYAN